MRFNWGHGIALALLMFASAMAYAVYKSMQNDYVYERKDYYEASTEYDQIMEAELKAANLILERKDEAYVLTLPFVPDSSRCRLRHPNDPELDHWAEVVIEAPGIRVQLDPTLEDGMIWNMELAFYYDGEKGLIRKRWKY